MKHLLKSTAILCGVLISLCGQSQEICDSRNGGDGYLGDESIGDWTFVTNGTGGNFIGSSTNNGDGDTNGDGDITSTTDAWGLWANDLGIIKQQANLEGIFLTGDHISIEMDNGYVDTGSRVGFSLINPYGNEFFTFFYEGGNANYSYRFINDTYLTTVPYTDEGIELTITFVSPTQLDFSVLDIASGISTDYSTPDFGWISQPSVTAVGLYNFNAGTDATNNVYFNNLEVCRNVVDNDSDGWLSHLDCNDDNPDQNPGATEILYNDIDDDCNPETPDFNSGITESIIEIDGVDHYLSTQSAHSDSALLWLGDFYCDDQIIFDGAEVNTFKCEDYYNADIEGASIFHRVYTSGSGSVAPFTETPLTLISNDGDLNGCSNQTWGVDGLNIDLLENPELGVMVFEYYTTATYTYTDGSGTHEMKRSGQYTYSAIIFYLEDDILPQVECSDFELEIDATGTGVLTPEDLLVSASDNCEIDNLVLSQTDFDCSNLPTLPYRSNDLLISEYIQTAGQSFENYVEIYNGTYDVIDLSNYELRLYKAEENSNIPYPDLVVADNLGVGGFIQPGEALVFCHAGANLYGGDKIITTNYATLNDGNYSLQLFNLTSNQQIDLIGSLKEDPEMGYWEVDGNATRGQCLRRLPEIHEGISDSHLGFPTLGTEWESFASNDYSNLGQHSVDVGTAPSYGIVLSAIDENGNAGHCTSEVTFSFAPPALNCASPTIYLDAAGNATISENDIDENILGGCGIASTSLSETEFNCDDLGENTVTLSVTDIYNNTSTCDAIVTIADNIPPTAVCQNISIQLDGSGNASITPADIDGGSTDICGIASLSASQLVFDISHVGANTITLTVTDNGGNTSTCDAIVTVSGDIGPEAICKDIELTLDENGNAILDPASLDDGSTAPAGIASYAASQTNFSCSDAGENTVTLTVTDLNGNVSTCESLVTVSDIHNPEALCQDVNLTMGLTGLATLSIEDVNNGSSDNCEISSMELSQSEFTCEDIPTEIPAGELIISEYISGTWVGGNGIIIINNYIEVYNGTPVAIDLANYELRRYQNGLTNSSSIDPLGAGGIIEPGGNFVFSMLFGSTYEGEQVELENFSMFYDGSHPIELFNVVTNQTVDIIGTIGEDPDVAWNVDGFSTRHQTLRRLPHITEGATENLPGFPTLGTEWEQFPLDDFTGLGSHESNASTEPSFGVVLTVNDINGNSSTCTSNITFDYVAPEISCTDATIYLDETGMADLDLNLVVSEVTTGCGVDTVMVSKPTFDCAETGETVVTLTVIDVFENISTCDATVTIIDNLPPTAICKNIEVELDEFGLATISAGQVNNGSYDNCSISNIEIDNDTFDCTNAGENNVTLTITDGAGLSTSCTAVVTVIGTGSSELIITPPADLVVNNNPGICGYENVGLESAVATGNCGVVQITSDAPSVFQVGSTTVIWTASDENNNTVTATQNVEIVDNEAPTVTPPSAITADAGAGICGLENLDLGSPTVSDNCGIDVMSNDAPALFPLGETTVTWTVSDVAGNQTTATQIITIVDTEAPTAICNDITIQLDEMGLATLSPTDIDGGSTDNCVIADLSLSQYTFDCNDMGSPGVFASDLFISEYVEGSGNNKYIEVYNGTGVDVDLSEYSLKVYNNGATSPNTTSSLSVGGTISSGEVAVFRNSSATNIPGSYVISATGFNGDDPVVLFHGSEIIDIFGEIGDDPGSYWSANGNVSRDQSLRRNVNIIAGNTENLVDFPNLGSEWTSAPQDDLSDLGTHISDAGAEISGGSTTVILTVTDLSGNTNSCTANITIEDNIPPTAVCQDIVVSLDETGFATILPSDVDGGSTDNCGIADISLSQDRFDCSDIARETSGDQTWINEFHYDNASGDVGEFIEVVSNIDASGFDVSLYNGNGNSIYNTFTLGAPAATDNGFNIYVINIPTNGIQNGPDGIALSDGSGTLLEFISYEGTLTGNGGPADGITSTDVGVNESNASIGQSLQLTGNGAQAASFSWSGPATDSPGAINTGQTIGAGIATTVDLIVTDVNGNSTTCTAQVTVEDNLPPTVVCQNATVALYENGLASITVDQIDNNSFDNCGLESLTIDIENFDCTNIGINDVTLTAIDIHGNSSSCVAQVNVTDDTAPTAICQDVSVSLDANGVATISTNDIDNGSSDNCGIATMVLSRTDFSCADLPSAAPSVRDQVWINELHYDNNSSDVNEGVEVVANFDISDYTLIAYNGSNGASYNTTNIESNDLVSSEAGYDFYAVYISGLQNGGPDGIALISDAGDVVEFISYEGSFTASNGPAAGMPSTDIGVSESSSSSAGHSLQLSGSGQMAGDFTWSGSASSTFGAPNNNQTFGSGNDGIEVTLTVTDNSGNQSICTAMVTVTDEIAPTALCQNMTVSLDENGVANIDVSQVDAGSFDNCTGPLETSISQSAFDSSHIGENSVTLSVTDASGNVSTCQSTVTIIDDTAPTAICQNVNVALDENGIGTISVSEVNNGSFDNCGIASMELSNYQFDCTQLGPYNSVTLTVTDVNGNSATCIAQVNVEETVLPTILCQAATIYLDADGIASITVQDIDNGSFDNCGISNLSLSQTQFDCSDIGENTVTLFAMDFNGNEGSCQSTVTVVDNTAPQISCTPATVSLDENGIANINVGTVISGVEENCDLLSINVSQSTFDCSHIGENIVTVTSTDVNGNTSSCETVLTVTDEIAPEAICQDIDILLDENGFASISADDLDNGSTDICGINTLEITSGQTTFSCEDIGMSYTVEITATDHAGNQSTCSSSVTILFGSDDDEDGVSNSCDICEGDDSTGDTDGDGICDSDDICAGAEDLVFPDLACDNELTLNTSTTFSANNGEIHCINGPFNGGQINISNGSTVRLSGAGNISVSVGYTGTLEIMSGSDIQFDNINVNWGAVAMVVNADAEVSYDGTFSPNATVVNCGTITVKKLQVNNSKLMINNGTIEITHSKSESTVNGNLVNHGYIHSAGSFKSGYNGLIENHCHIDIDRNLKLDRFLDNYAFINVDQKTTMPWNGRFRQYDGAMFRTNDTRLQGGRYLASGTQCFVEVLDETQVTWGGGFQGNMAFCDANGIESQAQSNIFYNGAVEDCAILIEIDECNPVGHYPIMAIAENADTDQDGNSDNTVEADNQTNVQSTQAFEQSNADIKIWPNPSSGEVTLTMKPVRSDRLRIDLYSMDGSLVMNIYEGDVTENTPLMRKLDLNEFQNGVYFMRFVQNGNTITKKLVLTY